MKYFILIGLLLSGCGYRSIPPSSTHEEHRSFYRSEIIAIDAGHGGKDPGAISKKEKYEEKQQALSTAHMVRDYLGKLGYRTLLTRNRDTYISLDGRADIANTLHVDLFVSIHYNYSPNKEAQGVEVYYYKENKSPPSARIVCSKQLGEEVLKKIIKHTEASSRGAKEADFAVIREAKMPAILIEGGFLSNPEERNKLEDPQYLQQIAQGIAEGIDHYLQSPRK